MKYAFYLLYALILALVIVLFTIVLPRHTQADETFIPPVATTTISRETPPNYTKDEIQQAVISACANYQGCDKAVALAIVQAETANYTQFVGDNGLARGIAQIRKDYHPEITDAQAFNLKFSANFLAKNLALGYCSWMWSTCPLRKV